MLMALSALLCLAALIAVVWTLTERSPRSAGERLRDGEGLLNLTLGALRACVGTDSLSPEPESLAHGLLATLASLTGSLVPAVLLGIVLIKLFALRPFIWRRRASISPHHTSDFPVPDGRDADHAVIAVRFYNHFDNLSVVDLKAQVHLRYLETSPFDGSRVIYKKWLEVLDEKGQRADERSWLAVERGAPFTVWIPVDASVDRLPLTSIQGKDLSTSEDAKLMVRLTARTVGLGSEVADERWFDLDAAQGDFELGRFVPLRADPERDVWQWQGWERFDLLLTENEAFPDGQSPRRPAS
ncbi:hypothetical protein ACFVW8_24445 [Streptomyces sp. NPDC058221]|uniref:hypothetical protein n=1 Tax=Streptomyces sp. NPDC058221 TaxID=3346388 RepID=UPI0036E3DE0B